MAQRIASAKDQHMPGTRFERSEGRPAGCERSKYTGRPRRRCSLLIAAFPRPRPQWVCSPGESDPRTFGDARSPGTGRKSSSEGLRRTGRRAFPLHLHFPFRIRLRKFGEWSLSTPKVDQPIPIIVNNVHAQKRRSATQTIHAQLRTIRAGPSRTFSGWQTTLCAHGPIGV